MAVYCTLAKVVQDLPTDATSDDMFRMNRRLCCCVSVAEIFPLNKDVFVIL